MSLHTPPEFVQKRIIQSVQNDKEELLKYLIFNYSPDDKSEILLKTKLLSLITNDPNCFNTPLITGAVWLTDPEHQLVLMTHTQKGWNIPCLIANSDADLEAVISNYLKEHFNLSATSNGIFDLDYSDDEGIYEICFLMTCNFPKENILKNSRLMTKEELDHISFDCHTVRQRRLNKGKSLLKQRK